jgi:hypothetical protein
VKEGGAGGEGPLPAEESSVLLDGCLAPPPLAIMTISKGGALNQNASLLHKGSHFRTREIHPVRVGWHGKRHCHGIGVIFPAHGIAKGLKIAMAIVLKIRGKRHTS